MRLLVTGASGLLGLNLSLVAAAQGHDVTGLVHSRSLHGVPFNVQQVDLLETDKALKVIESEKPEAVIHCAALADLNKAEKSPGFAQQLNTEVPASLSKACLRWSIPFVQVSTDAVFDGEKGDYTEADPTNPLSVYARTKLAGEQAVLEENPNALVTRVVFFGWSLSGKRSLSEFFFNHLKAGKPHKGFVDVLFSPLYAEHLALILLEMITAKLQGIYHVVSPVSLSKYEFGVRIARRFGFNPDLIEPIHMHSVNRGAPRSLNLVLNPGKVESALGHSLPSVDDGLDWLYQRWQEGYPESIQNFASW